MSPFPTKCVRQSHGQPFARNHCSTSRCPPFAAAMHVNVLFHGQPFACAHCSTLRCPPCAAAVQVAPVLSHGQPFARARPGPLSCTYAHPTGTHSRASTAGHRDARRVPPLNLCSCPTGSRPRATPSTPRDVHPSPLPDKGVLDVTGALPVAGAAPRLNIRELRRDPHQAL